MSKIPQATPKELAPIFEELVPIMTQDFTYTSTIPTV
jgi:hypothetical protein